MAREYRAVMEFRRHGEDEPFDVRRDEWRPTMKGMRYSKRPRRRRVLEGGIISTRHYEVRTIPSPKPERVSHGRL